jgi:transposase
MRAYSQDLRSKVLAAYDRGMRTAQIASVFGVSPAWARRVRQRRREHGELSPRSSVGKHPRKIDRDALRELVGRRPDATLAELRAGLGVACAISAVWNALRDLKLSYKKRPSTQRSRIAPMSLHVAPSGSCGVPGSCRLD